MRSWRTGASIPGNVILGARWRYTVSSERGHREQPAVPRTPAVLLAPVIRQERLRRHHRSEHCLCAACGAVAQSNQSLRSSHSIGNDIKPSWLQDPQHRSFRSSARVRQARAGRPRLGRYQASGSHQRIQGNVCDRNKVEGKERRPSGCVQLADWAARGRLWHRH